MLSKIKLALLAASLFSSVGLASPALAASHARHSHATISRDVRAQDLGPGVRAQDLGPRRGYWQAAPAGEFQDYPHVFCCS